MSMNLTELAEMMGAEATEAEAEAMRELLAGRDPDDVGDAEWRDLLERATELASVELADEVADGYVAPDCDDDGYVD